MASLDNNNNNAAPRLASRKIPVHVEVCLKPQSTTKRATIEEAAADLIMRNCSSSLNNAVLRDGPVDFSQHPLLAENVYSFNIVDLESSPFYSVSGVLYWQSDLKIHVFQLSEEGVAEEMADESEEIPACQQWMLPAREFHDLWESLVFDSSIKYNLLEYAATTMLFADKAVNTKLINWNRVVLLHGPPGTGKTSLCKGLAQKLSIRLSKRYPYGQLIEINSHSLFSKWFSESGKLVMKLFKKIQELIEDQESLVCVLIDEVESLTAARQAALSGSEPSDAIRVVNALLTQLDSLKNYNNVLILTTSNITKAIDLAFVDRADIKQYIGPPSQRARYDILRSCVLELVRVGIISPAVEIPASNNTTTFSPYAYKLNEISAKCEGLSGRALRKLPFLAHAFFLQAASVNMEEYLGALEAAVDKESVVRKELDNIDNK